MGEAYPSIGQSWRRNWPRVIPFFDYPPEIRRVIYTTNAIESVNMSLRKITKNRGSFPSDDALLKLFYLALRNISKKMDHADSRLEGRPEPVYYPIRRPDAAALTETRLHKIPDTPQALRLTRRFVELVEQIQSLFDRPSCRARTKACFGVELDEGNSGQFFHELVHADLTPLGQQAQPLMFIVRQPNR